MRIGDLGAVGKTAAPTFDFSKVKLFIGIPTRGQTSIDFSENLAVTCCLLKSAKADIEIFHHQNSCFVCMSRNKLIAKFLQSDCTHLFFVDDDTGWNADAVLKMIALDKEFIAGVVPLKTDSGHDWNAKFLDNPDGTPVMSEPGHLLGTQYTGGAFCILKRSMLEKMEKAYPNLVSLAVDPDRGYHFFESIYEPIWMTEDYVFCDRWRQIGGEIWSYPDIQFKHQGIKSFQGNYMNYRLALKKKEQEGGDDPMERIEKIISDMREFAKGIQYKYQPPDTFVPTPIRNMLSENLIKRVADKVETIGDPNSVMAAYGATRLGER